MSNKRFHEDLAALSGDLIDMGRLVNLILERSVSAFADGDRAMAEWALDNADETSRLDSLIEDEALRLLVLYQPMAGDMRRLATILKVITYLERIGRYGRDIAVAAIDLIDEGKHRPMPQIAEMGALASDMVADAIKAFETSDILYIKDFEARDDILDRLRYEHLRHSLEEMKVCACNVDVCSSYLMVARYLERCGDNACKIAEKVYYMATGKRIEIR